MTITALAELAKAHWKETNPEVYQQMVDNGNLEKHAEANARLALQWVGILCQLGKTSAEAWQECKETWLLTNPQKFYHNNRVQIDNPPRPVEPQSLAEVTSREQI